MHMKQQIDDHILKEAREKAYDMNSATAWSFLQVTYNVLEQARLWQMLEYPPIELGRESRDSGRSSHCMAETKTARLLYLNQTVFFCWDL